MIEEMKNIGEKLKNEKNQNEILLLINDSKRRLLNVNSFFYKFKLTTIFSGLSFAALCIIDTVLMNIAEPSIINTLPEFVFPTALMVGSFGSGLIINNMIYKKYDFKNRLRNFSNAKTDKDKLEEEMKYEIEIEKLLNKNKIIDKKLSNINEYASNQNENNQYDCYFPELKSSDLPNILEEKHKKLDGLITQKVLIERFYNKIQKKERRVSYLLSMVIGGFILFTGYQIPILSVSKIAANSSLLQCLIDLTVPFVIGSGIAYAYDIRKNKISKKVFDSYNKNLEEYTINPDINFDNYYSKINEINSKIKTQINEISFLEVEILKNNLNSKSIENDNACKEFEKNYSNIMEYQNIENYFEESEVLEEEKSKTFVKKFKNKNNNYKS